MNGRMWRRLGGALRGSELDRDAALAMAPAGHWRRFFARTTDFILLCALISGLMVIVATNYSLTTAMWLADPKNELWFVLATAFLAILAEAAVFGATGTTVGKSMLGIRVATALGDRPSFRQYLLRQWGVAWAGAGLGVPVAGLIAFYLQYKRLKAGESAYYNVGRFVVKAPPLGNLRAAVAIAVVSTMFIGMHYLGLSSRQDERTLRYGHPWTNKVTAQQVSIPAGWLSAEMPQEPEATTFAAPRSRLVAMLAHERFEADGPTLEAYADGFQEANADSMRLEWTGIVQHEAGWVWTGKGQMAQDPSQRIAIFVVPRGNMFWRLIVIAAGDTAPDGKEALDLRSALLKSL